MNKQGVIVFLLIMALAGIAITAVTYVLKPDINKTVILRLMK